VRAIAKRHRVTPAQLVFRFAQQRGMIPLTGTRDPDHMQQDLAIATFALDPDELTAIDGAG
jgi:diketogulonate reductase-like aldo/keto reductase